MQSAQTYTQDSRVTCLIKVGAVEHTHKPQATGEANQESHGVDG